MNTPVEEDYINKKELALRLKKTRRTIDHWMKRGWLPYYKIGRCVRFKWSEVDAELQKTWRVRRDEDLTAGVPKVGSRDKVR